MKNPLKKNKSKVGSSSRSLSKQDKKDAKKKEKDKKEKEKKDKKKVEKEVSKSKKKQKSSKRLSKHSEEKPVADSDSESNDSLGENGVYANGGSGRNFYDEEEERRKAAILGEETAVITPKPKQTKKKKRPSMYTAEQRKSMSVELKDIIEKNQTKVRRTARGDHPQHQKRQANPRRRGGDEDEKSLASLKWSRHGEMPAPTRKKSVRSRPKKNVSMPRRQKTKIDTDDSNADGNTDLTEQLSSDESETFKNRRNLYVKPKDAAAPPPKKKSVRKIRYIRKGETAPDERPRPKSTPKKQKSCTLEELMRQDKPSSSASVKSTPENRKSKPRRAYSMDDTKSVGSSGGRRRMIKKKKDSDDASVASKSSRGSIGSVGSKKKSRRKKSLNDSGDLSVSSPGSKGKKKSSKAVLRAKSDTEALKKRRDSDESSVSSKSRKKKVRSRPEQTEEVKKGRKRSTTLSPVPKRENALKTVMEESSHSADRAANILSGKKKPNFLDDDSSVDSFAEDDGDDDFPGLPGVPSSGDKGAKMAFSFEDQQAKFKDEEAKKDDDSDDGSVYSFVGDLENVKEKRESVATGRKRFSSRPMGSKQYSFSRIDAGGILDDLGGTIHEPVEPEPVNEKAEHLQQQVDDLQVLKEDLEMKNEDLEHQLQDEAAQKIELTKKVQELEQRLRRQAIMSRMETALPTQTDSSAEVEKLKTKLRHAKREFETEFEEKAKRIEERASRDLESKIQEIVQQKEFISELEANEEQLKNEVKIVRDSKNALQATLEKERSENIENLRRKDEAIIFFQRELAKMKMRAARNSQSRAGPANGKSNDMDGSGHSMSSVGLGGWFNKQNSHPQRGGDDDDKSVNSMGSLTSWLKTKSTRTVGNDGHASAHYP